jgi:hypothetical protein
MTVYSFQQTHHGNKANPPTVLVIDYDRI